MHSQQTVVNGYVHQALAEQDFLEKNFIFPSDRTQLLTEADYQHYLCRLAEELACRKQGGASLALTRGHEAVAGLQAYLASTSSPQLPFKELELQISAPLKPPFLEVLASLAAKDLSALKLTVAPEAKLELTETFLNELSCFIKANEIPFTLELPPEYEAAQLVIDELTSVARRKKMIAAFEGKGEQEDEKPLIRNNNRIKRKRNPLAKTIIADVEIQEEIEIAIELEASIEPMVEEQFEDKTPHDYIDRAEFLRRVEQREFKVESTCYEQITGCEKATFDHWLGNVSQHVVKAYCLVPRISARQMLLFKIYDATAIAEDEKSIEQLKSQAQLPFKPADLVIKEYHYPNPRVNFLTTSACEILLRHQNQFQYGLDFDHLPDGFILLEATVKDKLVQVLTYDAKKARVSRGDPLAIQLRTLPAELPLSWALVQEWLQSASVSESDDLLRAFYKSLRAIGSRQQLAEFRRLLPLMFSLSKSVLKSVKTPEELIQEVKAKEKILEKKRVKPQKHFLFIFLRAYPALVEKVIHWTKCLRLSQADLNKLLKIYDSYGAAGLFAIFSSWEKTDLTILTQLHQHYFPHCTSFCQFVDDPSYAQALDILNHFSLEERAFWGLLFEQHCAAVGHDHLLSLVKAFQFFIEKIKEKNLTFYTPCHFKGIKSLPVALSRMLTILNHTRPEDLNGVWKSITQLDLQSNAAIRLITDKPDKPGKGQLLVPEMQAQPENYYDGHDNKLEYSVPRELEQPHGYHALQVAQQEDKNIIYAVFPFIPVDLDEKPIMSLHQLITAFGPKGEKERQQELERNYYRYLAMQEHRLSLKFYQEAARIIDKRFPDEITSDLFEIRKCLYALVAAATSGLEATLCLPEEKVALFHLEELCDLTKTGYFMTMSNAKFVKLILKNDIVPLAVMPSLPYLYKIINIVIRGISTSYSDLLMRLDSAEERFHDISSFLSRLSDISITFKSSFYQGTKFIDIKEATHEDFYKFSHWAWHIAQTCEGFSYSCTPLRKDIVASLISLMSSFQLDKTYAILDQSKNYAQAAERNPAFGNLLAACLRLLTHLDKNVISGRQLCHRDLLSFMEDIETYSQANPQADPNQAAPYLVQAKFGEGFAKNFFENLASPGLSEEVQKTIQQGFETVEEQKLVSTILLSFTKVGDSLHRLTTVKSLIRIGAKLTSGERKAFLAALATLNVEGDNSLEELNELLVEIGNRGHLNDFIFMRERAQIEPAPALISKIITYYRQALPFIYANRPKAISPLDLQPLATRLILNTHESKEEFKTYFGKLLGDLYPLLEAYPNEKQVVFLLLDHYLNAVKEESPHAVELRTSELVHLMRTTFLEFPDADLLRSLADHYCEKPLDFQKLLQLVHSFKDGHFVLSMVTALLNNNRACPLEGVKKFLSLANNHEELMTAAKSCYENPPYPTLEQVLAWHEQALQSVSYAQEMRAFYASYNLKPCEREPENGFDLKAAESLSGQFEGVSFSPAELAKLAAATGDEKAAPEDKDQASVKNQTVAQLKAALEAFRELSPAKKAEKWPWLIAVLAELLYRSKGKDGGSGNSYEINTVQYLALLSFLKSKKGHITSETATGEGKSRIMMLAAACQWVLGKTVDFVTSDPQLAERDYLEYQAFFKMIGAPTRLITESSPASSYCIKGINFSDVDNLNLFRNKAKSHSQKHLVLDPDKSARALCLDENDRPYFDLSENRFNYSHEANENIKDMEWIYPLLVRYFTQEDPVKVAEVRDLYENDIDGCTEEFMSFCARQKECTPERMRRLQGLPLSQVEAWQDAAATALKLEWGEDYTLELNVLIETAKGPQLASEARLIAGHLISRNSKFSFGVHQCLHAYLNQELAKPDSMIARKCAEQNQRQCELQNKPAGAIQPFFLHPEKQIIYSSTSKSFLDEYAAGSLWAVTGTAGSTIEREEAAILYGAETEYKADGGAEAKALPGQRMEFVTVPRKNPFRRLDYPLHLTGNFAQRVAKLAAYIVEARRAGRPVLLICENDREAELLGKALKNHPAIKEIPNDQWQAIDSTASSKEEKEVIERAGQPGMVTVATARLGRGKNIRLKLKKEEQERLDKLERLLAGGLRVLGSYFPRERELWQFFGRAARFGAAGDARLVVDKEQLCGLFGTKELDTDFFLSNEFYVKLRQMHLDRKKQAERLVRHALSNFRFRITDNFFNYYDALEELSEQERNKRLMLWSDFTKRVDQLWNGVWPDLAYLVGQDRVNMPEVKNRLAHFREKAQEEWRQFHQKLPGPKDNLPGQLSQLELDPRTEHLLRFMLPKRKYTVADRTQVYKAYDQALDGRAVIYDELFAETKAWWRGERRSFANTRAWWEDHGILFANTRAWWAGKRPLFANLQAWLKRNETKKPAPVNQPDIESALKAHDRSALNYFVRKLNTVEWLESKPGDLLLNFKIGLVEAVLDYAHQKGDKLTLQDMDYLKELLEVIKTSSSSDQQALVTAMKAKLPHRPRFFSHPLEKAIDQEVKSQQMTVGLVRV